MVHVPRLALALGLLACAGVLRAQFEFDLSYGALGYRQTTLADLGRGVVGPATDVRVTPGFRATALYRPRRAWGIGVRGGFLSLRSDVGPEAGELPFAGVGTEYVALTPTIVYRPAPWVSLDAHVGRTFALSSGPSDFDFDEAGTLEAFPVEAEGHAVAGAGVTLAAGVAALRLGYVHGFRHETPGLVARADRPEMRWGGFEATLGLRFGTAHRRYGRPRTVDSLLTAAFSPWERRLPRWRVSLEADAQFVGQAFGELLPGDDVLTSRLGLAAAFRQNERWLLRGALGWRRARVVRFDWLEGAPDDEQEFASTITREIVVQAGAERRVWRDFAVGLDVGPAVRVVTRVRPTDDTRAAGAPQQLGAPVPRAAVTLLADPYLRYYAGERLTFDATASLTVTNPYGREPDRRLEAPQTRQQVWGGLGVGISYALVR